MTENIKIGYNSLTLITINRYARFRREALDKLGVNREGSYINHCVWRYWGWQNDLSRREQSHFQPSFFWHTVVNPHCLWTDWFCFFMFFFLKKSLTTWKTNGDSRLVTVMELQTKMIIHSGNCIHWDALFRIGRGKNGGICPCLDLS